MTFAETVRHHRKVCGYSQREFAKILGVNFTYISKIETGNEQKPSEDLIQHMANIFGFGRFEKYELVVLSGKVPEDFKRIILTDSETLEDLFGRLMLIEAEKTEIGKAIKNHLREKE